ncbi:MAG TPA: nuclear transport factor 2 family protein [Steroidobacteraceae bacterium]|nr:nuclear transport factor 2 family protein [Steroidobacteraceae bacterium]
MMHNGRRGFMSRAGTLLAGLPLVLAAAAAAGKTTAKRKPVPTSADERLEAMEKQMQQMASELGTLKDVNAIRRVQFAYGYYMDKQLYDEVADLFADDGEVHFGGGIYRGKAGVRRLYTGVFRQAFAAGANGPVYGLLLDHLQLQEIIDVAPDRRTARARSRCFMQAGSHESKQDANPALPRQWWEGGIYENTYAKADDGIWRIRVLNYRVVYQGQYEDGWAHWKAAAAAGPRAVFPENPQGPDELETPLEGWPGTAVVPFHYAHPVTGKNWAPSAPPG